MRAADSDNLLKRWVIGGAAQIQGYDGNCTKSAGRGSVNLFLDGVQKLDQPFRDWGGIRDRQLDRGLCY